MILEGLFGSVIGAGARLLPEVLKFLDRNNDRKHEYRMFELQTALEKQKGDYRVEEKYVDFSVAQMETLEAAYKAQAVADSKASQWIANLSASVRPGIAWFIFLLYAISKIAFIATAINTGQPILMTFTMWGPEDNAMLMTIIGYFFVNRSIEKYRQ